MFRADSKLAAEEVGLRPNILLPVGDDVSLLITGDIAPRACWLLELTTSLRMDARSDCSSQIWLLDSDASMYFSMLLLVESGCLGRRGGGIGGVTDDARKESGGNGGGGGGDDNVCLCVVPFKSSVSSFKRSVLSNDLFGVASAEQSADDSGRLSSGGFEADRRPKRKRCHLSNVFLLFSIVVNCRRE